MKGEVFVNVYINQLDKKDCVAVHRDSTKDSDQSQSVCLCSCQEANLPQDLE